MLKTFWGLVGFSEPDDVLILEAMPLQGHS